MSHAYPPANSICSCTSLDGAPTAITCCKACPLIDRADTVHLDCARRPGGARGDLPGVPEDRDLTVRAARLLQTHAPAGAGVSIRLDKVLPLGGGLGAAARTPPRAAALTACGRSICARRPARAGPATGCRCAVFCSADRICRRRGRNPASGEAPPAWYWC